MQDLSAWHDIFIQHRQASQAYKHPSSILLLPRLVSGTSQNNQAAAQAPHFNILGAWMGLLYRLQMDGEGGISRAQPDLSRWMLVSLSVGWCEEAEGSIRVQKDILEDVIGAWHGARMVGGGEIPWQHSASMMSCHCC